MTLSPTAIATARRNLAQRMERYLEAAERDGKSLGPWETDLLCRVVALLETGGYRMGEDVMLYVERPDLYCTPKVLADVADGPMLTAGEVRANLAKVLQGD